MPIIKKLESTGTKRNREAGISVAVKEVAKSD